MQSERTKRAISAAAAMAVISCGLNSAGAAPQPLTATLYQQSFDHSTWKKSGGSDFGLGWGLLETGAGSNANYSDTSGTATAADTYVFHTGSDNDLAFGTLRGSTALVPTIGANFKNTFGAGTMNTIVGFTLSYTGEQWRRGGAGADGLDFQISSNATSLSTGTWIDQNALDFNAPITTGAAGALDGNLSANKTAISSTVTGLSISNNSEFWIRWNDLDVTNEHGLGIDDLSLQALTTGYNSQITSSGTVAFGRVMQGSTASNNSSAALTKAGTQNTEYTATGNNNGITVTAPGTFGAGNPENHNITVALANNANGTASTGTKAYTVTVDNTAVTSGGAGQGSADANDTVNVTATVLADRVVTGSAVNFGRSIVNNAVAGTSNLATTGSDSDRTRVDVGTSAVADGNGVGASLGTGTGATFNDASDTDTRSIGGTFTSTGLKSGTMTLVTTSAEGGAGLAGEVPFNVSINYSGTAVADRVVTASAVNLGTVLVNTAATGSSTLSSAGSDNDFTRLTVNATAGADGNGVSVTGGTTTLFNGSTGGSRNLSGTFASAGAYSSSIGLTTTSAENGGAGLSGESVNGVSVAYTATVLDHANASFALSDTDTLNLNFGTVFQNAGGGTLTQNFDLYNLLATAGYTAKLELKLADNPNIESGDVSNVFSNDVVAFQNALALAAGSNNSYLQQFDTTNLGVFSATYTLNVSDEVLAGATSDVLTINVSGEVIAVPEPTVMALASFAGVAALLRRRRR